MRKLYPVAAGPVEDIPGTGPAPMLMRAVDWIRVGELGLRNAGRQRGRGCALRSPPLRNAACASFRGRGAVDARLVPLSSALAFLAPGRVQAALGRWLVIGRCPVVGLLAHASQVTPDWERLTAQVEADEALKKQLGWVSRRRCSLLH